MFCRFLGLFWPIFASLVGGYINIRILPPTREAKIGQNNPKKRQNISYARGLMFFHGYRAVMTIASQSILET
jgi:hypothetical protein